MKNITTFECPFCNRKWTGEKLEGDKSDQKVCKDCVASGKHITEEKRD